MTDPTAPQNLIRLRGGTAAAWTARNPVLADREPAVETDTRRLKIGDGHLPWADLDYVAGGAGGSGASLLSLLPEVADVVDPLTSSASVVVGALTTTVTPSTGTTFTPATAPMTVFGAVLDGSGTNIVNDPHAVRPSPAVEFDVVAGATGAMVVSVVLTNAGATSTVRAIVHRNGVTTITGTTSITAGGTLFLPLTIPAGSAHRIRVEVQHAQIAGLRFVLGSAAISPTVDRHPRVATFGDSWVEGALGVAEFALWPNVLSRLFGLPAVARMGAGGSGYVATVSAWNAMPYTDPTRLARLVAYAPELVLVQGSQNDDGATPAAITAAAATMYDTIADALPHTRLVVVGPPRLNATPSAARLANRDAVQAAAQAAPNVLGFVDQLGANPDVTAWIRGTGRAGATNGTGNSDVVIGTDSTHLTAEGHAYFARRVYAETVRLLRAAA